MKKNKALEIFLDGSSNLTYKTVDQKTNTLFYIENYKSLQKNSLKLDSKQNFLKNLTKKKID